MRRILRVIVAICAVAALAGGGTVAFADRGPGGSSGSGEGQSGHHSGGDDNARHEPQHLELARRELLERDRGLRRARAARELLDQPARHGRREERSAGGHDADRSDELLHGHVLEQEAARPARSAS